MTKKDQSSQGRRKRRLITEADQQRIIEALEVSAKSEDFIALRLRAFVYLLWDGAVRTRAALALNIEEVIDDSAKGRIRIAERARQRPCEENRFGGHEFYFSPRARKAIADYLKSAEATGRLPGGKLKGALFLSSRHVGEAPRCPVRSILASWRRFLQDAGSSAEYQLDDIVYTGRIAYVDAAEGDTSLLSQHAHITEKQAATYQAQTKRSQRVAKNILKRMHD